METARPRVVAQLFGAPAKDVFVELAQWLHAYLGVEQLDRESRNYSNDNLPDKTVCVLL
jgi:hypothetical protein